MLFVMAHDRNAYAAGNFSEQKVIRKSLQVDAPLIGPLKMKSVWISRRRRDK
jgi:hypothetical protein